MRKMIAERLVMCRVKLKIKPAIRAGRMSGKVTLRNVYCASPPRMFEASSIEGSICCNEATPARTEAGRLSTIKAAMMIYAPPTSAKGISINDMAQGILNATIPATTRWMRCSNPWRRRIPTKIRKIASREGGG